MKLCSGRHKKKYNRKFNGKMYYVVVVAAEGRRMRGNTNIFYVEINIKCFRSFCQGQKCVCVCVCEREKREMN